MTNCLSYLKKHGTSTGVPVEMLNFQKYENLIDLEYYKKIETKYETKTAKGSRLMAEAETLAEDRD